MIYLLLFWEFFKIGVFAIGGGLSTLPFLYQLSDKYGWFTNSELTNMIAVSESTPGPLGANMATYAGYHTAGIGGSFFANLGLVLPSIIIVIIVCQFLSRFNENTKVQNAFWGLRPAVVGLIAAVAVSLIQIAIFTGINSGLFGTVDVKALILFAVMLPLIFIFKKHPVFYIAIAAVVGIVCKL